MCSRCSPRGFATPTSPSDCFSPRRRSTITSRRSCASSRSGPAARPAPRLADSASRGNTRSRPRQSGGPPDARGRRPNRTQEAAGSSPASSTSRAPASAGVLAFRVVGDRAMLLCHMARQEIWCGDPDTGPDVRGDGAGAGGSARSHRAGDGHYRPGPPPAAPMEVSAELLGQSDDDALRATQEAEPVDVLVLRDLADEFGTVAAQAGNDVVDVVDSEHDAADAQRVRRRVFRVGSDRRRRVELRQLKPAVAVRGPHHGEVGTDVVEPDDAVHPTPLVCRLAFQLHTEFGEERLGSLEVVDHDENIVHPLKRHIPGASPGVVGAPVVALHLVSGAGQSFSTWNHSFSSEDAGISGPGECVAGRLRAPALDDAERSATRAARYRNARNPVARRRARGFPNGAAARAASRAGEVRPCRRVCNVPWAYRTDGARPVPAVAGPTGTGSSSRPTTAALCERFF